MVQLNRTSIQGSVPIVKGQKKDGEKHKPTVDNMKDLYKIYTSTQIPYFPASAMTAAVKKRTDALEKYIQQNNLDISTQNLELFFKDVKDNMTGGPIGSQNYLLKRFNDYIENGYNPDLALDKPGKPDEKPDTPGEKSPISSEQVLAIKAKIEEGFRFGMN